MKAISGLMHGMWSAGRVRERNARGSKLRLDLYDDINRIEQSLP